MNVVTQNTQVRAYFGEKLGIHPSDDFRGVCHIPQEIEKPAMDDVAVAIGYNSFVGRTCCIHIVVAKPALLTRQILREGFEFPFLRCGCEAVIALVDSTNEASQDFCARVGFRKALTIANAATEGDLLLYVMKRAECRWLRIH